MKMVTLQEGSEHAPELTFLHGFLGGPEQFDALLTGLPRDVSVGAVVLPGHGLDPETPDSSFLELCASVPPMSSGKRLRIIVGYSLGGRVALGAAARAPHRWGAVVAVGAHAGLDEPERSRKRAEDDRRAARVLDVGMERFVDEWETEPLFASQRSLDEGARIRQRRMRVAHTPAGIAWSLRHLGTGSMPLLETKPIRAHVALVAGERDPTFVAHARRMAPRFQDAVVHEIRGAGHNVMLEAPGALAEIILSAINGART